MSVRRTLGLIHLTSTIWFMGCIGYILVLTLRQAGVHWLVIFSLSGYSAVIILLLISLYLFAIFRGASNDRPAIEHPLTSTNYYAVFYVISPFLGALAGCLGTIGVNRVSQFLLGIALGTFGTTFLVWVIVDPLTGLLEMLLPVSRKHRDERLAQAKALREERQRRREQLLAEVLTKEDLDRNRWQKVLMPYAEKLASLLTNEAPDFQTECKAVDIGVYAWQIGGLSCMKQLHDMAIDICRERGQDNVATDYIPTWWDGIGKWQTPYLYETANS